MHPSRMVTYVMLGLSAPFVVVFIFTHRATWPRVARTFSHAWRSSKDQVDREVSAWREELRWDELLDAWLNGTGF